MTAPGPDAPAVLTIVSGLPRSGTSMMMRMLDAGGLPVLVDNVRTADEDNPLGYYEFEPVKRTKEDPSWLRQAPGRVVKMVYRLLYDLPRDGSFLYRVVFMRRKLEEVIASQDVMLARRGRESAAMPADKLLALFRQQIEEFEQWIAAEPSFRLLEVSYNDILTDHAPMVASINRFLGGGLDEAAMRAVVEPNLYRQRAGGE